MKCLAKEHHCLFSIKNQTLLFLKKGDAKQTPTPLPRFQIPYDQFTSLEITHSNKTRFAACQLTYHDPKTNTTYRLREGEGEPIHHIQQRCTSQAEGQAKAALKQVNQGTKDRPFLHWSVTSEKDRPGNGRVSDRNNPVTYLEGCEKMHAHFTRFATNYYPNVNPRVWKDIRDDVDKILRFEGNKQEQIEQWCKAIQARSIYSPEPNEADEMNYSHGDCESDREVSPGEDGTPSSKYACLSLPSGRRNPSLLRVERPASIPWNYSLLAPNQPV